MSVRAGIAVALVAALTTSCSHWYTRGAIAVTAGAAWGAGLGALLPCDDTDPNCQPGKTETIALIGILGGLAFWGIGELTIWKSDHSSSDGPSSGSTSEYASSSAGDDDGALSGGDSDSTPAPSKPGCYDMSYGGSTDVLAEPELATAGDDEEHVTSGGVGQGANEADACARAKTTAFGYLEDRCGSIRGMTTYLKGWVVYRPSCSCHTCGESWWSCSVNVEGVCKVAAEVTPFYANGEGSSDDMATRSAFSMASNRCGIDHEVSRVVLGCESLTLDGSEHHVCHVAVRCRRQ